MAVNDELFGLELRLAEYPEGEEGSGINRRLILREFAEKIDRAAYQRGYSDGLRDDSEARHVEKEIRRKRGLDTKEEPFTPMYKGDPRGGGTDAS